MPGGILWLTPGGGLKSGETFEEAAVRELREETGIENAKLLTTLWIRRSLLLDVHRREPLEVYEHYYLARVLESPISIQNQTASEQRILREHRWWSIDEIRQSPELFVPRNLGELLEPICRGEIPESPVQIGL
jgi:ADP-ribose pyrophosphatase YjhB (NUDIX family)